MVPADSVFKYFVFFTTLEFFDLPSRIMHYIFTVMRVIFRIALASVVK